MTYPSEGADSSKKLIRRLLGEKKLINLATKMPNYNLSFISSIDLFNHVKKTIEQYRFTIDLKQFNQNIIDPIKLTFDSKVYNKTLQEVVESEILRQLDKTNNNHIGYFHQNIFKYFGNGWVVPEKGFELYPFFQTTTPF